MPSPNSFLSKLFTGTANTKNSLTKEDIYVFVQTASNHFFLNIWFIAVNHTKSKCVLKEELCFLKISARDPVHRTSQKSEHRNKFVLSQKRTILFSQFSMTDCSCNWCHICVLTFGDSIPPILNLRRGDTYSRMTCQWRGDTSGGGVDNWEPWLVTGEGDIWGGPWASWELPTKFEPFQEVANERIMGNSMKIMKRLADRIPGLEISEGWSCDACSWYQRRPAIGSPSSPYCPVCVLESLLVLQVQCVPTSVVPEIAVLPSWHHTRVVAWPWCRASRSRRALHSVCCTGDPLVSLNPWAVPTHFHPVSLWLQEALVWKYSRHRGSWHERNLVCKTNVKLSVSKLWNPASFHTFTLWSLSRGIPLQ